MNLPISSTSRPLVVAADQPLAGSPVPPSAAMNAAVSRCSSALEEEHGKLLLVRERAPTDAERAGLTQRRQRLGRALVPAAPEDLAELLTRYFARFSSYGADAVSAAAKLQEYLEDLAGLPLWAVEMALRNIRQCKCQVAKAPPGKIATPDLIAQEARGARPIVRLDNGGMQSRMSLLDIEHEQSRLIRVLDATVYGQDTTPAERQIALARWAEIKRQMATAAAMPEPIEPGPEPDPIPAVEKPEEAEG
jgi:hypothetical protein